jgi:hypothetical protein
VNSGGLFAQTLGIMKKRGRIGFLSLPVDTDEFHYRYNFLDTSLHWASNIIRADGWSRAEDSEAAENAFLWDDPLILRGDAVNSLFWHLAEICGPHAQFGE